jgi:hypothetical protein
MKLKRRAFKLLMFLIAGAIVNVAVAWCCAYIGPYQSVVAAPSIEDHRWWNACIPSGFPFNPELFSRARKIGAEIISFGIPADSSRWHGSRFRAGLPCLTVEGSVFVDNETNVWNSRGLLQLQIKNPIPFGPFWPGFAINTVVYAVVLWMVFALPAVLRRKRRTKRGLCPQCAYPVGESSRCPECGQPVTGR